MTERRTLEALRYLGYGRNGADEKTQVLIEDCFRELEQCARKKSVYRIFECICSDEEHVKIGELEIQSRHLAKNLKGCHKAVMIAATLGAEVDRELRRLSVTDMAKAVIFQACAASCLEEFLDECQTALKEELLFEECELRPRFSPGYGDTKMELQEDIIRILDTSKRIGLTRTESHMLIPTKSVTAFIGISKEKTDCHRSGCEACEKTDCVYRRC